MKRWFHWAATVALIASGFAASSARAQAPPGDLPTAEEATVLEDGFQLWLVELSSLPTSDGGDLGSILAEQSTVRTAASAFTTHWRAAAFAVSMPHRDGTWPVATSFPSFIGNWPATKTRLPERFAGT